MKTSRSSKSIPLADGSLPFPALTDEASLSTLRSQGGLLSRAWGWIQARQVARSGSRRLRVAETVSLGEKRFVAVVQVDGRHFLLAGGPTNIALLAQLDANEAFEDVLKKTMTVPTRQPAKRKQSGKPAAKQNTPAAVSPSVPRMAQVNAPETFADVLQKTSAAASKQPAKTARKQNPRSAIGQTGHYA